MKFVPKTKPLAHQSAGFDRSKDLTSFGLFWEQGTGKTKAAIDNIAYLYLKGEIDCAIIVAPPGIPLNWVTDELPAHMSDRVDWYAYVFHTTKSRNVGHQPLIQKLFKHKGLSILAISYNSWKTDHGKQLVWKLTQARKAMRVIDESDGVKANDSVISKSMVKATPYFKYNRILSGTPIAVGPFDVYSQVRCLDQDFWKRELGIGTYAAFRSRFGVYEKGPWNPNARKFDEKGRPIRDPETGHLLKGDYINVLKGYQNLEELNLILKKISDRVLKADVLDLPPKVYTRRYYELTPAQSRIYQELENDYITWLDSGEMVTAENQLVRMMRLQQVLCGYVPVDGDKEPRDLIEPDRVNPRLAACIEGVEYSNGKNMIWGAWDRDIDLIMEQLNKMGRYPVQYDGRVSEQKRAINKVEFQKGDATDFVGKASAGGRGLTFTASHNMIFYNNTYKLIERLQAEDRTHRMGQTESCLYTDLICRGTKDEDAIRNLVSKLVTSRVVLGDPHALWLDGPTLDARRAS